MRGREDGLQSAEGVIIKGVGGLYYARGEDGARMCCAPAASSAAGI